MRQIKQGASRKLSKILLAGFFTLVITLMIMFFTETPVFAGTEYHIDTTNVATLQERLGSKATVVSGSAIGIDEEIITITLTENVNGAFYFQGPNGATYVLDAAGHTLSSSGNDGPIYVGGRVTVIVKGDGTYRGGNNYTVQVDSSKLIIESGEFIAGAAFWFIRGSVYFRLADGYDYYTATTGEGDLFLSHNRREKINIGSITFFSTKLKVSQHIGDVPTHNIEALTPSNGSYEVAVNGVPVSTEITAKVDDTITVTIDPDIDYKVINTIIKEESGKTYLTKYDNSFNFDMPNKDISIEVSFEWVNKIATQPTADNPIVVTNNSAGVISYQWYITSLEDFTLVEGATGTREISDAYIMLGSYDSALKTWSGNPRLFLECYRFFSYGDKIIISDIIGDIESCNGYLQVDGTYVITSDYIDIKFNDPGGSCKITWRGLGKVPVEGQTSDTYTGPGGKVNVKVTFSDGVVLTSDEIDYGEESPLTYAVTVNNGLGNGDYLEGATVSVTADNPPTGKQFKEWTVVKGTISLASSTSASTTFTMPAEEVELTATYEDIYIPTPTPPTPTPPISPIHPYIPAPTPIPGSEGKVEKAFKQDKGAPLAVVNSSNEELKASVLTPEERERVKAGEDAKIILHITDISKTVSEEEKKLINNILALESGVENNGLSEPAVLYIDFSLYKQVGKHEQTRITEIKDKISISIEVPEELRNTDETTSREFYILRIHNGEISRLTGSYDSDKHIFTFETDRFSTYVLAYKDRIVIETYKDFHHLQLKAKASNTTQTLSFKRVANVDGYLVYGGKCGEDLIKLAELPAKNTSYTIKNLKKGTYYKYQVKAFKIINGEQVIIMTSKVVHSITEGKKYGNPIKVTTDIDSIKLEPGQSKTVTGYEVLPKDKKLKEHTAAVRYESSNKEVATVNSKGKIVAKSTGSCYIYAYAQNGVFKRIKVTVD